MIRFMVVLLAMMRPALAAAAAGNVMGTGRLPLPSSFSTRRRRVYAPGIENAIAAAVGHARSRFSGPRVPR